MYHICCYVRRRRKQIDLSEDDLAALQKLGVRKKTNLKNLIEAFLHQVAQTAMHEEIKHTIERYQKNV